MELMLHIIALQLITTRYDFANNSRSLIHFLRQSKAEYAPYYKHSLLYLACVDVEKDMSPEERLSRAHDLGISALLGDTIYNFGELVSSPQCAIIIATCQTIELAYASNFGFVKQQPA